jgi:hypothetical protein
MNPRKAIALLLVYTVTGASAQTIDFGKSYINVTKGVNGGTLEFGDTVEICASIVVKGTGAYDSCSYRDAVPAGTSYVPGTVRVLTNEGKIFRQFTDASNDDVGWMVSGNVSINLGFNTAYPATAAPRAHRQYRQAFVLWQHLHYERFVPGKSNGSDRSHYCYRRRPDDIPQPVQ